MTDSSVAFVDSIPEMYHQYMGPMYFVPSAIDLVDRLSVRTGAILELACGTGILTRELLRALDSNAKLTATDLNEPMLKAAGKRLADSRLEFRRVDAMALPFENDSFDAVVCQYGVMFFPDKVAAAVQVRRVLRPGGAYLFNVWCSLEENPVARIAQRVITECYPEKTPMFFRVPWGYFDREQIATDLRAGGFSDVQMDTVDMPCRAPSPEDAATGMVQGTPMLMAIRERNTFSAEEVTRRVSDAIASELGHGQLDTTMRALAITAG